MAAARRKLSDLRAQEAEFKARVDEFEQAAQAEMGRPLNRAERRSLLKYNRCRQVAQAQPEARQSAACLEMTPEEWLEQYVWFRDGRVEAGVVEVIDE